MPKPASTDCLFRNDTRRQDCNGKNPDQDSKTCVFFSPSVTPTFIDREERGAVS
jgi:hypothetical protein